MKRPPYFFMDIEVEWETKIMQHRLYQMVRVLTVFSTQKHPNRGAALREL